MLNLKNIIDNLPSAVIVVDSDCRAIMANRMAKVFTGKDLSGLLGRRGGDIVGCVHAGDSSAGCGNSNSCEFCGLKCALDRAFREQENIGPFETVLDTGQNGPVSFKITVTLLNLPLSGSARVPEARAIVTVDDISVLKKGERLEAAMETIGAICHEMCQPLMVLSGQLDLLAMDIGENRRIDLSKEQLERMNTITRRLQSIRGDATGQYLENRSGIPDVAKACAQETGWGVVTDFLGSSETIPPGT